MNLLMCSPGVENKKIYCNACRSNINHVLKSDQAAVFNRESGNAKSGKRSKNIWLTYIYRFWICNICDTAVMEMEIKNHEKNDGIDYAYWPPRRKYKCDPKDFCKAPLGILTLYQQAVSAYNSQHYQLATLGCKAIFDAICQELGCGENVRISLIESFEVLCRRGMLEDDTVNALRQLKFISGDSVQELLELTSEEVSFVLDVIHVLIARQFESQQGLADNSKMLH
jgi:hypothetical protein